MGSLLTHRHKGMLEAQPPLILKRLAENIGNVLENKDAILQDYSQVLPAIHTGRVPVPVCCFGFE